MKKRLFVAVNLSMATTRKIADAVARMRPAADRAGLKVSWVPPQNLHVTLKFLGWAGEEIVEPLRDRVREILKGRRPFDLVARGAGAFPNVDDLPNGILPGTRRPNEAGARVLWIGLQDPSGQLARIAAEIDKSMIGLGFPAESRPFSGHVTVGRVKHGSGAAEVLAGHRETDFGSSAIRDVILYESLMKSGGSTYIPLLTMPLEGVPHRAERQTRGVEEDAAESEGPNGSGQQ